MILSGRRCCRRVEIRNNGVVSGTIRGVMKVIVPDIGDFADVAVIEILVSPGDEVAAEDALITLESDKATMDVPSPAAGKITAIHIAPGDKISAGTHIADMTPAGESGESSPAAAETPSPAAEAPPVTESESKSPPAEPETPSAESETPSAAESGGVREVRVPDIGDFANVAVIEVLASPGDTIAAEDSILTLESDKATMDVPAPFGGTVQKVTVSAGDKVSCGDLIALIEVKETTGAKAPSPAKTEVQSPAPAAKSSQPTPSPTSQPSPPQPTPAASSTPAGESSKSHASPSVRKYARELGADLGRITGSGIRGRILRSDVQSFIKSALQKPAGGGGLDDIPDIDFSQFGEVSYEPLSRIRRLSAVNLSRNWRVAPHVTQCGEADITDMEEFRLSLAAEAKKAGYRMTPLAFFIRAAVMALRQFPEFNSSLCPGGEQIALKQYFHVGVAVDTPGGLMVPVLRNADKYGLTEIARALSDISERARAGKLKAEEMRGGCFTISSLGGIGGSFFTPIINLPEVAIMGVSRAEMRPLWDGEKFTPRRMLPLSLSYDHRVIDGAAGARFITYYAALLADIRRLSL